MPSTDLHIFFFCFKISFKTFQSIPSWFTTFSFSIKRVQYNGSFFCYFLSLLIFKLLPSRSTNFIPNSIEFILDLSKHSFDKKILYNPELVPSRFGKFLILFNQPTLERDRHFFLLFFILLTLNLIPSRSQGFLLKKIKTFWLYTTLNFCHFLSLVLLKSIPSRFRI